MRTYTMTIENDRSEYAEYANADDGAVIELPDGTHEYYDHLFEGLAALIPNPDHPERTVGVKARFRNLENVIVISAIGNGGG